MTANRYAGRCACCGVHVSAGDGYSVAGVILCSVVEPDRVACEWARP